MHAGRRDARRGKESRYETILHLSLSTAFGFFCFLLANLFYYIHPPFLLSPFGFFSALFCSSRLPGFASATVRACSGQGGQEERFLPLHGGACEQGGTPITGKNRLF
jgi:hypothetical protein